MSCVLDRFRSLADNCFFVLTTAPRTRTCARTHPASARAQLGAGCGVVGLGLAARGRVNGVRSVTLTERELCMPILEVRPHIPPRCASSCVRVLCVRVRVSCVRARVRACVRVCASASYRFRGRWQ